MLADLLDYAVYLLMKARSLIRICLLLNRRCSFFIRYATLTDITVMIDAALKNFSKPCSA